MRFPLLIALLPLLFTLLPLLIAAPLPQSPTFEQVRNADMAAQRAKLKVAEISLQTAESMVVGTRAAVVDIRAQGITAPELDKALKEAQNAQKTIDQSRTDLTAAQQRLDAQAKSKDPIPGTLALVDKALDSSLNAQGKALDAVSVLGDAPEKVAPAKIVDAHLVDATQKQQEMTNAMKAADAAVQKSNALRDAASSDSRPAQRTYPTTTRERPVAGASSVPKVAQA